MAQQVMAGAPPDVALLELAAVCGLRLGHLEQASHGCQQVLHLRPDYAEIHNTLGAILKKQGKFQEAEDAFRQALRLKPDYSAACNNLGNLLKEQQRLPEAETAFRQTLHLKPNHAEACYGLATLLHAQQRSAEAETAFRQVLNLLPDHADTYKNLGILLQEQKRFQEAEAAFRQVLRLRPDHAEVCCRLAILLQGQKRFAEAETAFRQALRIKPDYAEACYNLGVFLQDVGRWQEAEDSYRQALTIQPDYALAHSNLLLLMANSASCTGAAILDHAKCFGDALQGLGRAHALQSHGNQADPDRKLRIGYLTPALTRHVLLSSLKPVIQAHRRDQVSVHVYAHVPQPDQQTRQLQSLADHWTFVHTLSDEQVAARIMADGIDILVDPMGHWANNRLPVFARKPAPIQVSYLCQGLTSGLSTMDYAIGDPWLNFDGAMQAFATEQVVELEHGFQVNILEDEPPIGGPPSATNGFVTFGSFNNPSKLSDKTLTLWGAVLAGQPGARLLLKSRELERPEHRSLLTSRMERHGLDPRRVALIGFVAEKDHLDWYNRMDIALDTLPFCGGRTTVDTLWMGVPVVSRIGETLVGRFSYSILARMGVPELVAHDDREFAAIAIALANDPSRLGYYRKNLRNAMKSSSLYDAALHVAELERAFRIMWQRWCAGLPPQPLGRVGKA